MTRLLMTLGTIMLGTILVAGSALGFIAFKSLSTAQDNTEIAISGVEVISKNWSLTNRGKIVHPTLLRVSGAENVRYQLQKMGQLGQLTSSTEQEQTSFSMSTETGTTATIQFRGTFENGYATVIVKLKESDGEMKIIGMETTNVKMKRRGPMHKA